MNKFFDSYAKVEDFYNKGRKLSVGRRVNAVFSINIRPNGLGYSVKVGNHNFMEYLPDNTVVFVFPNHMIRNYAQSIVSTLTRHFPFLLKRIGMGRYKVAFGREYKDWSANLTDYYSGISFGLSTGACLNPKEPVAERLIPEVRTQWLRDVRVWKKGIKARSKMGVFISIKDDLTKDQTHYNISYGESFCKRVTEAIKTNTFPHDLMQDFVKGTIRWAFRANSVTATDILDSIESYLKAHSYDLRAEYGVFGDT
jgi:hypothetical protein